MLEVVNKDKYSSYVFGTALLLTVCLGGLYWWNKEDFLIYLGIALAFEIIVLGQKFTRGIKMEHGKVEVTFYQFGVKKIKTFLLKDVVMSVDDETSESGRHKVLILTINGKRVHKVSDEDGFDRKDFDRIVGYTAHKINSPAL